MPRLNGKKIREIRVSMGLSQEKFIEYLMEQVYLSDDAVAIDWVNKRTNPNKPLPISICSLSSIERNRVIPRPLTARFIATGLRMTVDDLLLDAPGGSDEDGIENESSHWPMPVMIKGDMVYEGPDALDSIMLDEIIAVRESDSDTIVLGYAMLEEWPLKTLIQNWAGGGFEELLEWAGIEPETAGGVFMPDLGLLIGTAEEALLLVGRSGSRVRLEFTTHRTFEPTSVTRFSSFQPLSEKDL